MAALKDEQPSLSLRVHSLASIVHGSLLLPVGVAMMFFQKQLREALGSLAKLLPVATKQVFAEGAALALGGAVVSALGLMQLHTGCTSATAVEALVAAEATLALLLVAVGVFRNEPLFFALAAEALLFCGWGLVELYQQQRARLAAPAPAAAAAADAGVAAAAAANKKAK
jgi:hypothetical protein